MKDLKRDVFELMIGVTKSERIRPALRSHLIRSFKHDPDKVDAYLDEYFKEEEPTILESGFHTLLCPEDGSDLELHITPLGGELWGKAHCPKCGRIWDMAITLKEEE